ncbi:MAG: Lrp/AsnC family transcriptional regulator [Chitinivibrionales bacterium]|nr:Lrp/AsnC family transcriptional regulator [Chitinivibrionales bacterium]
MVTAISLIKAARRGINVAAQKLADIEGITEVYSVAGKYDLIAVIRAPSNEKMADIVTNHMLTIEGIIDTETMIAFRCFSRHDLESMFSIGFAPENRQ